MRYSTHCTSRATNRATQFWGRSWSSKRGNGTTTSPSLRSMILPRRWWVNIASTSSNGCAAAGPSQWITVRGAGIRASTSRGFPRLPWIYAMAVEHVWSFVRSVSLRPLKTTRSWWQSRLNARWGVVPVSGSANPRQSPFHLTLSLMHFGPADERQISLGRLITELRLSPLVAGLSPARVTLFG
jgi:hypothetical protein